jgi:Short C-terminal domain
MPDDSSRDDDLRRAMRDVTQELGRAVEQAGKVMRQAASSAGSWASKVDLPRPGRGPEPSPFALIRELGELRDKGLVTEEEFQAKKAELLAKV